ncbi:MAG: PAS domain S-box protein, partial [Bacteroidales bacterium]|nr:PAS domain S-box protein [Bacteroidales bacterium]
PLIVLFDEGNEDKFLPALHSGAFSIMVKDKKNIYPDSLFFFLKRSIEKTIHQTELARYRAKLESIIEERTSELIETYEKLKENEVNFRNIFQNAGDSMIITDYEIKFIEANEAFYRQFDVIRDQLSCISLIDFLLPEYKDLVFKRLSMLKQGTPTGYLEIMIRSIKTGKVQPFEVNSVPIVFNQKGAILTIIRDLTERKLTSRKVFEAIIQTEEDERKRFARDLHDEIGPLISALKIYTNTFLETNDAARKDKIARQIGSIMRDVIDSIKIISNDLSPHILENFGLKAAIQSFIDLFSKNVDIIFQSNLDNLRFPNTTESLIYRIIKELINNTVKHANASQISINLDYFETVLVCNYRDNGIGFDWEQQSGFPSKGLGISNIMARIRSLGGELEVQSKPGQGFTINFVFQTILTNASQS